MTESGYFSREDLVGCPDCDLLIRKTTPKRGYNLSCPRCGAILIKSHRDSVDRTLALSLSGLFLFIPACFLPLLKFTVLGFSGDCTMMKAAVRMFTGGYWWMGFLVMLCSIIIPFTVLFILFAISLSMKLGRRPFFLPRALKAYHHLTEWTMLDVYMIGLLISHIKLKDFGDIFSGPGLYSFIGLLVMTILTTLSFDSHHVWAWVEQEA